MRFQHSSPSFGSALSLERRWLTVCVGGEKVQKFCKWGVGDSDKDVTVNAVFLTMEMLGGRCAARRKAFHTHAKPPRSTEVCRVNPSQGGAECGAQRCVPVWLQDEVSTVRLQRRLGLSGFALRYAHTHSSALSIPWGSSHRLYQEMMLADQTSRCKPTARWMYRMFTTRHRE